MLVFLINRPKFVTLGSFLRSMLFSLLPEAVLPWNEIYTSENYGYEVRLFPVYKSKGPGEVSFIIITENSMTGENNIIATHAPTISITLFVKALNVLVRGT